MANYARKATEENRNLLSRKKIFEKLKAYKKSKESKSYLFKEANPNQLIEIRNRLKQENARHDLKMKLVLLVTLSMLSFIALIILFN